MQCTIHAGVLYHSSTRSVRLWCWCTMYQAAGVPGVHCTKGLVLVYLVLRSKCAVPVCTVLGALFWCTVPTAFFWSTRYTVPGALFLCTWYSPPGTKEQEHWYSGCATGLIPPTLPAGTQGPSIYSTGACYETNEPKYSQFSALKNSKKPAKKTVLFQETLVPNTPLASSPMVSPMKPMHCSELKYLIFSASCRKFTKLWLLH